MKVTLTVGLCLTMAAAAAHAAPTRYAVIVGDDQGDRADETLHYAEQDARRIADVLESVGGFPPENVTLLTAARADDVRRVLAGLNVLVRRNGGSAMLFVFYSGHADAESLHLNETHLALAELRDLTAGSLADARVLVVDSCRSGALTRIKGGRPAQSFEIPIEIPAPAQGMAILTSSAAGEDAQESDELKASIFTHHLVSALLGAADRDDDGRITIDEAFRYASQRTIAATVSTASGPQHPTYRIEMGGRADVALTAPRQSSSALGQLSFVKPGSYVVQRSNANGPIVAEATTDRSGGRLTIPAGRYVVTQRAPEQLRESDFMVLAGTTTTVDADQMPAMAYTRVSRKGDCVPTRETSLFVRGSGRFETNRWTRGFGGRAGVRLDYPAVSFELGAGMIVFDQDIDYPAGLYGAGFPASIITVSAYQMDVSTAALHVFPFRRWSLAAGLVTGAAWFRDSSVLGTHDVGKVYLGPALNALVPLGSRFYAGATATLEAYFVHGMHLSLWPRSEVRTDLGGGFRF